MRTFISEWRFPPLAWTGYVMGMARTANDRPAASAPLSRPRTDSFGQWIDAICDSYRWARRVEAARERAEATGEAPDAEGLARLAEASWRETR